jgi:hypothetical protein
MDTIFAVTPYLPFEIIFLHAEREEVYFDTLSISSQLQKRHEDEKEVVVLLYYPDCHFENIGRIVKSDDGKQKIVRLFSSKDDFIVQLRNTTSVM